MHACLAVCVYSCMHGNGFHVKDEVLLWPTGLPYQLSCFVVVVHSLQCTECLCCNLCTMLGLQSVRSAARRSLPDRRPWTIVGCRQTGELHVCTRTGSCCCVALALVPLHACHGPPLTLPPLVSSWQEAMDDSSVRVRQSSRKTELLAQMVKSEAPLVAAAGEMG